MDVFAHCPILNLVQERGDHRGSQYNIRPCKNWYKNTSCSVPEGKYRSNMSWFRRSLHQNLAFISNVKK